MKITDLELHLVEIPRTDGLPPVRSLLVRLSGQQGLKGWGEASLGWRPGELAARRGALLAVLAGRSLFDIEELQTLEALGDPPLRAAVEMACWDLAGRATGQPLCRLLGGEYRRQIPLAARLSGRGPDRAARRARPLVDQGFHALILPASGQVDLDAKMLSAVRQAVGSRIDLRLDAQAAFSEDSARELCAAIESEQVRFLLDPLSTSELYPVAALGRQTLVPLAVGRAVHGPADVLALARCGEAAYAVLDPEQLGGISPTRASVAIAAAARVRPLLGGRPALGIATAAMLHLAAATPPLADANESAYHQLQDDVLAEPLPASGGMISVPQGPGLGVQVDRAKIERYTVA
jgi:L-alanine-DL-glutamate epimerase-like enolase superfamily enzyme